MSENPSLQLSKKEMVAQMGALTFAGHETTANTLTWMLWELAKHPEYQDMLRAEIQEKRAEISAEGSHLDFSVDDLESMPFLQALIKVSKWTIFRYQVSDSILYRKSCASTQLFISSHA